MTVLRLRPISLRRMLHCVSLALWLCCSVALLCYCSVLQDPPDAQLQCSTMARRPLTPTGYLLHVSIASITELFRSVSALNSSAQQLQCSMVLLQRSCQQQRLFIALCSALAQSSITALRCRDVVPFLSFTGLGFFFPVAVSILRSSSAQVVFVP